MIRWPSASARSAKLADGSPSTHIPKPLSGVRPIGTKTLGGKRNAQIEKN